MRWYFCHGTKYEDFTPLYNDGKYILVQNDATKKYSFGLARDFGTLCGFPVNQSCLTLEELQAVLAAFIQIDAKYNDVCGTSKIYEAMKRAVV
jgi:hypothetical protein